MCKTCYSLTKSWIIAKQRDPPKVPLLVLYQSNDTAVSSFFRPFPVNAPLTFFIVIFFKKEDYIALLPPRKEKGDIRQITKKGFIMAHLLQASFEPATNQAN